MPLLEHIINLVAPHSCMVCNREGSLLCAWCWPDACESVPERCYKCYKLSSNSKVCEKCRRKTPLGHVWVRSEYGSTTKELIRILKFERARGASKIIAELMSESLPYIPEDTIFTHIPTSTTHVRQRGYDQSRLIAKQISKINQRSHHALLSRIGQVHQVGSKRFQRVKQLDDAFRATNSYLIKGKNIILVDDVLTTGATLEQAAKTLKKAGAKKVDAIVFAQTI